MFRLKIFTFLVVVAAVTSKVIDVNNNEVDNMDTSEISAKFEKVSDKLIETMGGNRDARRIKPFISILKRSIDYSCVKTKLENANWMEKFNNLYEKMNGGVDDTSSTKEKNVLFAIFFGGGFLCSSKNRPIHEFIFDALMSGGHLVRAFKDEPELKDFQSILKCANHYAIEHNIWDNSLYPIDGALDDEDQFICSKMTLEMLMKINEIGSQGGECAKSSIKKAIHLLLRTVLLLQVELTPEQRATELEKFISDHGRISEESLACLWETIMKDNAHYGVLRHYSSRENYNYKITGGDSSSMDLNTID